MEAGAATGGSHAGCTPGEGVSARSRPYQGGERDRGPKTGEAEATGTQGAVGDDGDSHAGLAAPSQHSRQHTSATNKAPEGGQAPAERTEAMMADQGQVEPPPQPIAHGKRRTRPATQQATLASTQNKAARQAATKAAETETAHEERQRERDDAAARGAQEARERTSRHLRICQLAASRGWKVEERMRTTTAARLQERWRWRIELAGEAGERLLLFEHARAQTKRARRTSESEMAKIPKCVLRYCILVSGGGYSPPDM